MSDQQSQADAVILAKAYCVLLALNLCVMLYYFVRAVPYRSENFELLWLFIIGTPSFWGNLLVFLVLLVTGWWKRIRILRSVAFPLFLVIASLPYVALVWSLLT